MRRVLGLIGRLRQGPPPTDPATLREQMKRDDPAYRHVSEVQHDALGLIGASRNAQQLAQRVLDGRSIRHEREFWSEHGGPDG